MGAKVVDSITHVAQTHSDSEEDEDEPICPLGDPGPPPMPNPTIESGMPGSHNTPVPGTQMPAAPTPLSESDEEVPTLDPIQRRQLKRVEQRRYSLRTRGREGGPKPP